MIQKQSCEGSDFIIKRGAPREIYKETDKYIAKYDESGGIEIFHKVNGKQGTPAGQIDGLMLVNGKPIILEAKASNAKTIVGDLNEPEFINKKINTIKELTGQTPEVLILVPKGESSEIILSNKLNSLKNALDKEGVKMSYDELPETAHNFNKLARILKEQ